MLRILTYHRVDDPAATPALDPAQVSATPDDFRRQVRHLASSYRVVALDTVIRAFRDGRPLPDRAVLVTFDDAYRDFGEIAWPILKEHGLPATVFVPTAFPDGPEPGFWWDRLHRASLNADGPLGGGPSDEGFAATGLRELKLFLKSLPPDEALDHVDRICAASPAGLPEPDPPPVLDWDELRALREDGVDLGSHTRTHPALVHATDDRIREELRVSVIELANRVGDVPRTICYPYGLVDDRVTRIAREEGFELGFASVDGAARPGITDPLRLPRTNITRRTSPWLFRLRMRPWFVRLDRWRHRHERRRRESRRIRTRARTGADRGTGR